MTKEEREKAKAYFQSRLEWKKENRHPYVSAQEAEIYKIVLEALEQEPCDEIHGSTYGGVSWGGTHKPQEQTGHCKDCKYFEYDSVAKVDGIPLIVAHEICSKWGDGCKTKEDGYCFLFEPQERSGKE